VLGAATLLLLVALERFVPKVPAPLVAVAVGVAAIAFLGLDARGVETVGTIPRGLPSLVLPDLSLVDELWPGALGCALMSFTESIAAARAFASRGDPPLQPNHELFATGIANAGGALLGAMASGGGTSQTAVNKQAGARSQLASIVTAGIALLTMLVLAPLIGLMPQTTLAAIVIVYSVGLIEPAAFRSILAIRRTDRSGARRRAARHAEGDSGRDRGVDGGARDAGSDATALCRRPQARDRRLPAADR
jgi:MFS superfamily sulfate permease-like transporter